MDKNIKNIIFDFGGVLIDLDVEGCLSAFEQAGAKDIRQYVTGTNELGFFKDYECGAISTPQFRENIRHYIGSELSDAEIDRIWNSELKSIPQEKFKLIEELSHKYRLFILSNTNELHWNHAMSYAFDCDGKDMTKYFERMFVSYDMHLAKPDPQIFKQVLKEAGLVGEETLFIDDSKVNCAAAVSAGLHSAHYEIGTDLKDLFM